MLLLVVLCWQACCAVRSAVLLRCSRWWTAGGQAGTKGQHTGRLTQMLPS
jgi:hypothetical protein